MRINKIIMGLFLVSFLVLSGCGQAPTPEQEIVSVNIVELEPSDMGGFLTEEQICERNNGDNIEIKYNVQVKDYQKPIYCKIYENGVMADGFPENSALSAYNGLNSQPIVRDDFRVSNKIKVCCSTAMDIAFDKCSEKSILPRCS